MDYEIVILWTGTNTSVETFDKHSQIYFFLIATHSTNAMHVSSAYYTIVKKRETQLSGLKEQFHVSLTFAIIASGIAKH